jgi:uncharacterized protein
MRNPSAARSPSGPTRVAKPPDAGATLRSDKRRRIVVVVTLVAGATLLGFSFSRPAGSTSFYLLTLALAAVGATGALVSGPIPLGRLASPGRLALPGRLASSVWMQPAVAAVGVGAAAGGVFVAGAVVVRQIGALRGFVTDVVSHTHGTSFALIVLVTVLNAVAEELFFRGAVYAALGRWRGAALTSTAVYVAAIAVSGDVALIFAAAVLGAVLAFERRISGGVLAPILTHVTWSVIVLLALPPLFDH